MFTPRKRVIALGLVCASPVLSVAQQVTQSPTPTPTPTPTQTLAPVEVTGTRERLDAARNGLSPDTGSTIYRFDRQDIRKDRKSVV